jgi:hypothetical protein
MAVVYVALLNAGWEDTQAERKTPPAPKPTNTPTDNNDDQNSDSPTLNALLGGQIPGKSTLSNSTHSIDFLNGPPYIGMI